MSDWWSGYANPPLIYRTIHEWQQLAMAGSLRPDDRLYDPVRGIWQRAGDHPELRLYFPAPAVNSSAVLGLGAFAALAAAASASTATANRAEIDLRQRKERRTGKKRVFVSFDFDDDKV